MLGKIYIFIHWDLKYLSVHLCYQKIDMHVKIETLCWQQKLWTGNINQSTSL